MDTCCQLMPLLRGTHPLPPSPLHAGGWDPLQCGIFEIEGLYRNGSGASDARVGFEGHDQKSAIGRESVSVPAASGVYTKRAHGAVTASEGGVMTGMSAVIRHDKPNGH